MIKTTALVCIAATTLFVTGCSSYPSTSEGVAKAVCNEFKAGDLDGAKTYMADSALKQTANSESVISKFFALPDFKEKAAKLDCSKPSKTQNLEDGHKIIYFGDFNTEVKIIDGDWKLIG